MRKIFNGFGLLISASIMTLTITGCGSLEKSVMADGVITLEEFTKAASDNGYVVQEIDATSGYVACPEEDMKNNKDIIFGICNGTVSNTDNIDVNLIMYVPYEDMDESAIPLIDDTIGQFKDIFGSQDDYCEIDGGFAVTGDSVFIMVNKGESILEFIGTDNDTLLSIANKLDIAVN